MGCASRVRRRAAIGLLGAFLVLMHYAHLRADAQKLKPEELIAGHLGSIGTPEARAAVQNRLATGSGQIIFRLPASGTLNGKCEVVSDGRRLRLSMLFAVVDYPSEQISFDGSNVRTSQVRPGVRLALANFVYAYDVLLREGLIGGSMTAAWCLLDVSRRQPKIEYTGLKKIDGRRMHELKYQAKKGSGDFRILLHFDPETFRHLHTEYRLVQPAQMVSVPADSPSQRDTLYHIEESFGDFRTVDGLTLPHAWKLTYSREGSGSTFLVDHNLSLSQVLHNQALDAKAFAIR